MNEKIEKILNWSLAIVGFIGVFWFQGRMSERYSNTEDNGIDAVGIIISRNRTGSVQPGTGSKGIKFVFLQDGCYVKTNVSGLDDDSYEKAIVGMKYRVKYIPIDTQLDSTNRRGVNNGAIIYLNNPIYKEYKNIDSTRCWIHKYYYSNEDKIPGARPYKDILYLIPDEFKKKLHYENTKNINCNICTCI